jgi:hypothetical protein
MTERNRGKSSTCKFDIGVFTQGRRETGKEWVLQVHYYEGIANHIGPEPCAGIREAVGEASVGERADQPLSSDGKLIPGADAVCVAEGNFVQERQRKRLGKPGVVEEPGMHASSLYGNREISGSATGP